MTIDKLSILDEIRRTAAANGGVPLGRARFRNETGIKLSDWFGKFWRCWSEAVTEAGYPANKYQTAFAEDYIIGKLVELIRELGRYPVQADLRMKARRDPEFPTHTVFDRVGTKAERAQKIIDYCRHREGFAEVAAICQPLAATRTNSTLHANGKAEMVGIVYLMRSGRFYKIGRTNSAGRRAYELAMKLPERAKMVHEIKTDDPVGIEDYWHGRFRAKRRNGEWFDLSPADVATFRRRRFM